MINQREGIDQGISVSIVDGFLNTIYSVL